MVVTTLYARVTRGFLNAMPLVKSKSSHNGVKEEVLTTNLQVVDHLSWASTTDDIIEEMDSKKALCQAIDRVAIEIGKRALNQDVTISTRLQRPCPRRDLGRKTAAVHWLSIGAYCVQPPDGTS